MFNLNIEAVKSIQILCNRNFEKFRSYKLVEIDGEIYITPRVRESKYIFDILDDIDEEALESTKLMMENAANFIIDILSIRQTYAEKELSILSYDDWDSETLEDVCSLILSLVNKYGQLGLIHHIIYDYVKPELSIEGEYNFPTVMNPFFIQIKDGYYLRPTKISSNISYRELIKTFFPTLNTVDIFALANNTPELKLRYHEPMFYYLVVAEILSHIINSDNEIDENEMKFNDVLFSSYGRGQSFKISNASLAFSINISSGQYEMTYSFKTYFDFALFVLLLSKTKTGKPFARCKNKKCGKLFVKTKKSKLYCSESCKRSVNNKTYNTPNED